MCVCVNECLKGVQILLFLSPRGSTPAPLSSEAGLRLGDVDLDAVGAFRGGVLPHRRRALRRNQAFPGLLPLFVHSRVHAPVLPRRQLGLRLLLWHR